MTEQRDWPPEQSTKGDPTALALTAAGYLAALFEDPEEAHLAQRGLQQRGVPEGDLRLYDGEETLRMASRLQQERSILAKAIKELVVDHRAEKRWLGNARADGSLLLIYAPTKERANRMVGCPPAGRRGRRRGGREVGHVGRPASPGPPMVLWRGAVLASRYPKMAARWERGGWWP